MHVFTGVELETISLAQARKRGLGLQHTRAFVEGQQDAVLAIHRVWGRASADTGSTTTTNTTGAFPYNP